MKEEIRDLIARAGGWKRIRHEIPSCLVAMMSILGIAYLILAMAPPVHH